MKHECNAHLSIERIRTILKDAGLRCTQGRQDILKVLLDSDAPMSHEELCGCLRSVSINRVTVYRVLESFLKAGVVHRVEAGGRVWRFAVCGKMHRGHCHPHFICRECGRIECLNDCPMPEIPRRIPRHTVEEQEVYLRGLCEECTP
jgi:Fur family transcriptional regulator, ferric uptake regulator